MKQRKTILLKTDMDPEELASLLLDFRKRLRKVDANAEVRVLVNDKPQRYVS